MYPHETPGPVGIGACTATVNGETTYTAELIFAIQ